MIETHLHIYTLLQDQENAGCVDAVEQSTPVLNNSEVIIT